MRPVLPIGQSELVEVERAEPVSVLLYAVTVSLAPYRQTGLQATGVAREAIRAMLLSIADLSEADHRALQALGWGPEKAPMVADHLRGLTAGVLGAPAPSQGGAGADSELSPERTGFLLVQLEKLGCASAVLEGVLAGLQALMRDGVG